MSTSPEHTHEFDPVPASKDAALGAVAGNYHILAQVGSGAFGTVYKARDIKLGRTVALKMMQFPSEPAERARLEREAKLLAKLGPHASVVSIHAWGEFENNAYFALEYLPCSASGLLEQSSGGLPWKQATSILLDCAVGLRYAHEHDVIHGDIKPANILIDDSSHAKLCDFGMARWRSSAEASQGGIAGSPSYMAPEQLRGEAADERTDLYALGVTAYQLLTGALPYVAASPERIRELSESGKHESLRAACGDCPQELAALVDRCMAADISRRPASANEVAGELRKIIGEEKPSASGRRTKLRSWGVIAAAVVAVVIASLFLPSISQDGRQSGEAVVLADARRHLESGHYQEARDAYQALLAESPDNDDVRYGLGFALLLEGETDDAERVFGDVKSESLSEDGRAAVLYARQREGARDALHSMQVSGASGYAAVLAAGVDMAYNDYDAAVKTLAQLDESALAFDWQRGKYLQFLGQAYFRLGRIGPAREVFTRLRNLDRSESSWIADDYLEMTQVRLDEKHAAKLSEQIARLGELAASTADGPDDDWTSRPIRVWILPPDATHSVIARDTGLTNVFAWRLSNLLVQQEGLPVAVVERDVISTLLREQELSATLSSTEDSVKLGKLYGARYALVSSFNTLAGEESLDLNIVDVETTRVVPVDAQMLQDPFEPGRFFDELTGKIVTALRNKQPIRGELRKSANGQLRINIGRNVGVESGMRFRVMTGPGDAYRIQDASLVVTGSPDSDSAPVRVEGIPETVVPENGWLVEAYPAVTVSPDA